MYNQKTFSPVIFVISISCFLFFGILSPVAIGSQPYTVIDGAGNEITFSSPPQRIFSAGLAIDNILLSVVDPSRVVAVTYFALQEGSYVKDKVTPKMTLVEALNPELIVAINPDIVLVAIWNNPDAVRQIKDLGYKVYVFTAFDTVEDALDNIRRIGELTGETAKAQEIIDEFQGRYAPLKEAIEGLDKPRVLYLNSWGSTTGKYTSIDSLIQYAGGINLATQAGVEGWNQIDAEFIVSLNPDIIITDSGSSYIDSLKADRALASVSAVQQGNIYHVAHMDALNQHFILAIEALARIFHPQAF
jgi:iron complex transport system substrate-binding protein